MSLPQELKVLLQKKSISSSYETDFFVDCNLLNWNHNVYDKCHFLSKLNKYVKKTAD